MSDKTLSQRLRELKAAIQGGNNAHARKLVHECIAQAEALEAQAGELSDSTISVLASSFAAARCALGTDLYAESKAAWELGAMHARDHIRPSQAIGEQTPVAWAIHFHETYERLAPSFGYETRKETRAFDPESPNGKLMIAVCGELFRSPMSSDARDKAIEMLEKIWLNATSHGRKEPYASQAEAGLSALRP